MRSVVTRMQEAKAGHVEAKVIEVVDCQNLARGEYSNHPGDFERAIQAAAAVDAALQPLREARGY